MRSRVLQSSAPKIVAPQIHPRRRRTQILIADDGSTRRKREKGVGEQGEEYKYKYITSSFVLSLTRLVYRSRVVIRLTICYVYIYFTPCIVYTIGNRDSFVPPVFLRSGRRKNKCVLKVPFVYTLYIPYYESIELSNNFSYSFFFFSRIIFFFSFPSPFIRAY